MPDVPDISRAFPYSTFWIRYKYVSGAHLFPATKIVGHRTIALYIGLGTTKLYLFLCINTLPILLNLIMTVLRKDSAHRKMNPRVPEPQVGMYFYCCVEGSGRLERNVDIYTISDLLIVNW